MKRPLRTLERREKLHTDITDIKFLYPFLWNNFGYQKLALQEMSRTNRVSKAIISCRFGTDTERFCTWTWFKETWKSRNLPATFGQNKACMFLLCVPPACLCNETMEHTEEFVEIVAELQVQNMNRVSYVQWYFISLVHSTCPTGIPKVARYGVVCGWFLAVSVVKKQGVMVLNEECQFILDIRKKTYKKGDNTLKEFAQIYI